MEIDYFVGFLDSFLCFHFRYVLIISIFIYDSKEIKLFELVSGTGLMCKFYVGVKGGSVHGVYRYQQRRLYGSNTIYPRKLSKIRRDRSLTMASYTSLYNQLEQLRWPYIYRYFENSVFQIIHSLTHLGLFTGVLSDFCKAHFTLPRSYLLAVVTITALASQIAASQVDLVSHLWKCSGLLGLGYGMLFSIATSIVSEWFGLGKWKSSFILPLSSNHSLLSSFLRNLRFPHRISPNWREHLLCSIR